MANSKNIINRIKEKGIKPIPKSYFTIKNALLWFLFAFGVLIGAMAFSIILFSIQQTDFDLLAHMGHSKLEFLLGLLPFFWIVLLIIFLILAIVGIKNSRKGYKHSSSKLIGVSTALSILIGTLFFITGGAQKLEKAFAIRVSLYKSIEEKKTKIWSMPEEGYLSGEIQSVSVYGDTLLILDFKGKEWRILYADAFIPPVIALEPGEQIKLVGKILSKEVFRAEDIRPWGGRGMMERLKGNQKQNF